MPGATRSVPSASTIRVKKILGEPVCVGLPVTVIGWPAATVRGVHHCLIAPDCNLSRERKYSSRPDPFQRNQGPRGAYVNLRPKEPSAATPLLIESPDRYNPPRRDLMKLATRKPTLLVIGLLGMCGVMCAVVAAQRSSGPPQPHADRLPAVSAPRPNRGTLAEKPATAMPIVPAGFTVSVYAEMRAPRMMVYAPNGDLFVSSPATNTITVLRDANNDGVFEARGVYAGTPPADPPTAPPAGQRPAAPPPPGQPVNPDVNGERLGASAPACMAPPPFNNRGPGTVAAPFGLAFHAG